MKFKVVSALKYYILQSLMSSQDIILFIFNMPTILFTKSYSNSKYVIEGLWNQIDNRKILQSAVWQLGIPWTFLKIEIQELMTSNKHLRFIERCY